MLAFIQENLIIRRRLHMYLLLVLFEFIQRISKNNPIKMIKFGQEKVNFANSDRIQTSDPQFLTFRNNASNNTGRSIFSQKIEMHKGIQSKYQQDEQQPIRNFKKSNLPQRQKLKARQLIPMKKPVQSQKDNGKQQQSNQIAVNQFQFKNQLMRKKIQKLVKNIKNQQRKQTSLEKYIEQLEKELQDDQNQTQCQTAEIQELQSINEENQLYLDKLTQNYQEYQNKNQHLHQLLQKIQDSLESLINSRSQEDSKSKMAQKLKEGLIRLETLSTEVTNRCLKMHTEVQNLKDFIEHSENLDLSIRDTAYTRETQNNSHFTC